MTERLHFHALEKEMATHSSVLAWRIPGMGEPSGLLSMGSHKVGHNWSDLAAAPAYVETSMLMDVFAAFLWQPKDRNNLNIYEQEDPSSKFPNF